MKVFTFNRAHLVTFIGLIVYICSMVGLFIGEVIQTNATPSTNKTVILDARSWSSR